MYNIREWIRVVSDLGLEVILTRTLIREWLAENQLRALEMVWSGCSTAVYGIQSSNNQTSSIWVGSWSGDKFHGVFKNPVSPLLDQLDPVILVLTSTSSPTSMYSNACRFFSPHNHTQTIYHLSTARGRRQCLWYVSYAACLTVMCLFGFYAQKHASLTPTKPYTEGRVAVNDGKVAKSGTNYNDMTVGITTVCIRRHARRAR